MANMDYCQFQTIRRDMEDCLDALHAENRLSREEANVGRWMLEDILSYCRDTGIIDCYDNGMLEAVFEGLAKEDDDDE